MLKKRDPPPKKKSAAVRLELAPFGSQVQCAYPLSQYDLFLEMGYYL